MVDVLVAMKRALAVEYPGLILAVVDMLKSCSDYLSSDRPPLCVVRPRISS